MIVEKKYTSESGKVYIQKPVVLAQYKQLTELLKTINIPDSTDELTIALALGDSLAKAFAIVLYSEGSNLQDKNIEEFENELMYTINLDTTLEVIRDFFVCNSIHSLLNKIQETVSFIMEKMNEAKESTQIMK